MLFSSRLSVRPALFRHVLAQLALLGPFAQPAYLTMLTHLTCLGLLAMFAQLTDLAPHALVALLAILTTTTNAATVNSNINLILTSFIVLQPAFTQK